MFIAQRVLHGVLRIKIENAVTLPHIAQKKQSFLGEIKDISKTNKLPSRKKIALLLLHQILDHRYTRPLLSGHTANAWEDIELRIDPYPFFTSFQISYMNKKAGSKNPLNLKSPFKWVLMDIIPSTAPIFLTSDKTFSNYLLVVDAYSKIPKLYGMDKTSTEEVMDKIDMFQSRFGKIDEFGWWDLKIISADAGSQFISTEFKE